MHFTTEIYRALLLLPWHLETKQKYAVPWKQYTIS